MRNPIIGLSGGMCSGKDSWVQRVFVDMFGFGWQGTSDITRDYIREHDLGEPTRDLVREVSTELRRRHGADFLARSALARLDPDRPRVVTGLYVIPEAQHIKVVGGNIIHIASDDDIAFSRMSGRGRVGEVDDLAEFKRLIQNDNSGERSGTDQALDAVSKLADAEIDGNIPIADIDRCHAMAKQVLGKLGVRL